MRLDVGSEHPRLDLCRTAAALIMPHTASMTLHTQTRLAMLLETVYAAGFSKQRADGVHWLLTQQICAERVSGGLR